MKRASADWLILSAAVVTVVAATSLLASGPIYADAVTLAGLERILDQAPPQDANVDITVFADPAEYEELDSLVAEEVSATFEGTGGTLVRQVVIGSNELTTQIPDAAVDIVEFRYLQLIEDNATLVQGSWPEHSGAPYQAAISEQAARHLGLSLNDTLTTINRRDRSLEATVVVSGVYRIDDPSDVFWWSDQLALSGRSEGAMFNTYGPFIVALETALFELSPSSAEMNWKVFPDFYNLEVAEVPALRADVEQLEDRLSLSLPDSGPGAAFTVQTRLPSILGTTDDSLVVTRSGVLMLTVQLAILAGYALVLTAGLLVESRRTETSLLRARGASNRQISRMAALEGVMLTVPAALVAPWLAALALRALNRAGPLAGIGLSLDPTISPTSYLLSFVAAAGCVIVLVAPARRSAESFNDSFVSRGRQETRSAAQRTGIDLALLAIAAIAFWQLATHGAQITSAVQGLIGIDPLLVAAPALGLFAGAVLALRIVPLLARFAEKIVSAARAAVPALSAWQVARRPARYARAALLLMMAIAIGLFVAAYSVTWTQSQDDQADYQAGADINVTPNRGESSSIEDLHLSQAHQRIPGLEDSMPILRSSAEIASSRRTSNYLMLDASQAGDVVQIRDDLSTVPFEHMMGELADRRPDLATVPIPGEPEAIALSLDIDATPAEKPEEGAPDPSIGWSPEVNLVIQDGDDLMHRIQLDDVAVNQGPLRVMGSLTSTTSTNETVTPTYPLSLVDIEIVSPATFDIPLEVEITFTGIEVNEDGEGSGTWSSIPVDLRRSSWAVDHALTGGLFTVPAISLPGPESETAFSVDLLTGTSGQFAASEVPVLFSVRPAGTDLPDSYPVVVSAGFLEATSTSVGDEIVLPAIRPTNASAELVGTVTSFPTVDPGAGEVIILDLPTFQMMTYQVGTVIQQIEQRWVSAQEGEVESVAETLRGEPFRSFEVLSRVERAESLKSDPVALGTIGALSLGFVAAAVFAAVGFTVSAAVSARERITEFALLRALGLSPRQLGTWLALEQGTLVVVSVLLGTLIGVLLAALVLPLIAITQQGSTAVPGVIVIYPWPTVVWLEVSVLVVLAVIVSILTIILRRMGLGSLLRLGEER